MKLTKADKELLLHLGHTECDLAQIEVALCRNKTMYSLDCVHITRDEAVRLLGRKKYLAGISRSAFHSSAVQYTDSGEAIYFDSSRMFQ